MAVAANALCITFVEYDQVLWLRVLAGIGSGIFTSVAVVTLGGTTKPVRAFNMLLFAFAFSAALQIRVLSLLSMNGIYMFFICTFGVCAFFLHWVPTRALNAEELIEQKKGESHEENWHVPRFMPVVCLTAICFTYINIGGYYNYIELAAMADGVTAEWSNMVLTTGAVFALVGCGLAMMFTRFGLFRPLFVSLLVMASVVVMLTGGINDTNFMVSLFAFNTMWTFVDVYQEAMMSHMDRTGSFLALIPAVQGFGNGVGPNLAASVLAAGMGYSVVFLVSAAMALIAMFIYIGVSIYMHKRRPVEAEAN